MKTYVVQCMGEVTMVTSTLTGAMLWSGAKGWRHATNTCWVDGSARFKITEHTLMTTQGGE